MSLVGNIKGYVVIGNTIKMPKNNTRTFDVDDEVATTAVALGPIEPGFKNAVLSIKNGKYSSFDKEFQAEIETLSSFINIVKVKQQSTSTFVVP